MNTSTPTLNQPEMKSQAPANTTPTSESKLCITNQNLLKLGTIYSEEGKMPSAVQATFFVLNIIWIGLFVSQSFAFLSVGVARGLMGYQQNKKRKANQETSPLGKTVGYEALGWGLALFYQYYLSSYLPHILNTPVAAVFGGLGIISTCVDIQNLIWQRPQSQIATATPQNYQALASPV